MRPLAVLIRQVRRSSAQATVFVLCVALSLAALTAVAGFSRSIERSLGAEARLLQAADVIVRSREPLEPALAAAVAREIDRGAARRGGYVEFPSVVRSADGTSSVLARVKAVEAAYPLYGRVVLRSDRTLAAALTPGTAVVEASLLQRLDARVGDALLLGAARLTIGDVVVSEPDRPVTAFSIGPRVLLSRQDLDQLDLLQPGSRATYAVLLAAAGDQAPEALAGRLRRASRDGFAQVDTFRTAPSGVKRFLDNVVFFLKLAGIFVLFMAGVGIHGTLNALLAERRTTLAIMKALGATNRYVVRHVARLVMLLGLAGIAAGILGGVTGQWALVHLLASFLPAGMGFAISAGGVLEGLATGVVVVALFTALPLWRLRALRPVTILRQDEPRAAGRLPVMLAGLLLGAFGVALIFWHMRDLRFGVFFVAGIGVLVAAAGLAVRLALAGLRRWRPRALAVRHAVRGLFRRHNATRTTMTTLSAALFVILALVLVERNLAATFVDAYPADAPNLFCLDIQADQRAAFSNAVGRPVTFYPVIRARVAAVNGEPVDHAAERRRRRDNFGRLFNLTYRADLLADERLAEGKRLFRPDWSGFQVSILDTVRRMHPVKVGDTLRFTIQGVPLEARISSIRTRTSGSPSPFFYFVLQPKALAPVPHTAFAALRVPPEEAAPLQTRLANGFPNISVIDLTHTIRVFAGLLAQLTAIVRGFSALSVAAGVLILISAIFATRPQRLREAAYVKILGAPTRFITTVHGLETALLAGLSGLLSAGLAQVTVWAICRWRFEIGFRPFWPVCGLIVAGSVALVTAIGLVATRSVRQKTAITYLREHTDE